MLKKREHKNVRNYANELSQKGCNVLISNADTIEIKNLYKDWEINELEVTRFISAKSFKRKVGELIIKNY